MAWIGRVNRDRLGTEERPRVGCPVAFRHRRPGLFLRGFRQDLSVEVSDRAMLKAGFEVKQAWSDYRYWSGAEPPFDRRRDLGTRHDTVQVALRKIGHEIGGHVSARIRPMTLSPRRWGSATTRSPTPGQGVGPPPPGAVGAGSGNDVSSELGPLLSVTRNPGVGGRKRGNRFLSRREGSTKLPLASSTGCPGMWDCASELYHRSIRDQRPRYLNAEQNSSSSPRRRRPEEDRSRPGTSSRDSEVMVEAESGGTLGLVHHVRPGQISRTDRGLGYAQALRPRQTAGPSTSSDLALHGHEALPGVALPFRLAGHGVDPITGKARDGALPSRGPSTLSGG